MCSYQHRGRVVIISIDHYELFIIILSDHNHDTHLCVIHVAGEQCSSTVMVVLLLLSPTGCWPILIFLLLRMLRHGLLQNFQTSTCRQRRSVITPHRLAIFFKTSGGQGEVSWRMFVVILIPAKNHISTLFIPGSQMTKRYLVAGLRQPTDL